MRQRIQLTDTNRPIAWSEWACHDEQSESMEGLLQPVTVLQHVVTDCRVDEIFYSDLRVQTSKRKAESGDYSGEVTPVPIPNTVVKLLSADDTWWVTAWENRTPPVRLFHLLQTVSEVCFFIRLYMKFFSFVLYHILV